MARDLLVARQPLVPIRSPLFAPFGRLGADLVEFFAPFGRLGANLVEFFAPFGRFLFAGIN